METPADRKSTRLNSSHGYISYAVFCLKKKKLIDCRLTTIRHVPILDTDHHQKRYQPYLLLARRWCPSDAARDLSRCTRRATAPSSDSGCTQAAIEHDWNIRTHVVMLDRRLYNMYADTTR